jgi:hypothetical protein
MTTIKAPQLYALVRQAADKVGNATQLAKLVGVSLSAMLRGAKNQQLSADVLLAIAEYGALEPGAILHAADKGDTARRLVRLYGKPQAPLTADDRALLALDAESKRQLLRIVTTIRGR